MEDLELRGMLMSLKKFRDPIKCRSAEYIKTALMIGPLILRSLEAHSLQTEAVKLAA